MEGNLNIDAYSERLDHQNDALDRSSTVPLFWLI